MSHCDVEEKKKTFVIFQKGGGEFSWPKGALMMTHILLFLV